jgi:hypothetical protein
VERAFEAASEQSGAASAILAPELIPFPNERRSTMAFRTIRGFQKIVATSFSQNHHEILGFMPDNHVRIALALVLPPAYFRICFSIGDQIGNPAHPLATPEIRQAIIFNFTV